MHFFELGRSVVFQRIMADVLSIYFPAEVVDEKCGLPTDDEIRRLEEFLPTRSYTLTLLKPTVCIQANELPEYDVKKKRVLSHRKLKKVQCM